MHLCSDLMIIIFKTGPGLGVYLPRGFPRKQNLMYLCCLLYFAIMFFRFIIKVNTLVRINILDQLFNLFTGWNGD